MKKVFLLMAVCLPMFIFTACNNDDDDNKGGSESIVGTWYRILPEDNWEYGEYGSETTFNSDGTGNTKTFDDSGKLMRTIEGLWKVEGEYLYIAHLDDPDNWKTRFSISGDKLYLYDCSEHEEDRTQVWTRGKIPFNK